MTVPQIFTDFNKNLPCQVEILAPKDDEVTKRTAPEYIQADELLKDQLYSKDSLSKQIVSKTNFVILLRNLPEIDGTRDANKFDWFAGYYMWEDLVKKLLDLENISGSDASHSIYLVPTIGQSDPLSIRHELTYNAFICPSGQVPFNHLVQRHIQEPKEGETVDLELDAKSDKCSFPTLDSVHLTWDKLMEFTNEYFEFLPSEKSINVYILKTTKSFQTSFKRMYQENPQKIEEWYDTVVKNFLPLIPYPLKEGKLTRIPLVLVDPIETTPESYKRLIRLVDAINAQFSMNLGEVVRAIKNVIRYWQFNPTDISEELLIFANNDHSIPKSSPEFNKLFFSQLSMTRNFIVDEILDGYLHIKRPGGDYDFYKDAPSEVDEELEKFDQEISKRFLYSPQEIKDKFTPVFNELKEVIEFWFNKGNLKALYDEFKTSITNAMNEMLSSESMLEYLKISQEENNNNTRNQWLNDYYDIKNTRPPLYCLWPTIYLTVGVLHKGEKNPILEHAEQTILKNIYTNTTLPEARGKPIPPKEF